MLRLGSLAIDPPLVLAPMAGVTDRHFRLLLRRLGGVGLVSMEFLRARGLVEGDRKVWRLVPFSPEERPIAVQVYGSDAATMAEAARLVEAEGADVVDVNMGCPANKVLKGCAGAALMRDLRHAESIVAAVRRAVSVPVTVKFRLGLDSDRRNFVELGRICAAHGVDAVTLHARTAAERFTGAARWDEIARLKEALPIPVVGNGDVTRPEDAVRMLRETGCDAVMIGRGATRDPWIFRRAAALLAGRPADAAAGLAERRRLVLAHFRAVVAEEEPERALHKLRVFTGWYSHGFPEGQRLRRRIADLRTAAELVAAVEEHCDALVVAADVPELVAEAA